MLTKVDEQSGSKMPSEADGRSMYELVGGMETFHRLAEAFYRRVEADTLLRPMYPGDLWGRHYRARMRQEATRSAEKSRIGADSTGAGHAEGADGNVETAAECAGTEDEASGDDHAHGLCSPVDRLAAFLAQFFGGPQLYSDQRGHPRLRMRHTRFKIGQAQRDAWLGHMCAAIQQVGIEEPIASVMRQYFDQASTFLINAETPS